MKWIECGPEHVEAIRTIFNDAILHSTALYDYEPRSEAVMQAWWQAKVDNHLPVIGVLDSDGVLMAFGTYGAFRPHAAYQHTIEHSVYVEKRFRGRGLGRQVLQRLIARARSQGYHLMLGVIDAENEVSLNLHQKLGFQTCGLIREAGFKFDRWLDIALCQKNLREVPEAAFAEIGVESADYPAVLRLREEVLRLPIGLTLQPEDLSAEASQRHFVLQEAETRRLLACVIAQPLEAGVVKLRQMAVSPESQSLGLGKHLVERVEGVMRGAGCALIQLHARLEVQGFYAKLGYQRVGPEFEEVGLPHVLMTKLTSQA